METLQKNCSCYNYNRSNYWGLIGIADFKLVAYLFGETTTITRFVYTLVGIAGLINLGILFNHIEK
jgi:uncharacterized membrane protein YuzA (DUF378 family)